MSAAMPVAMSTATTQAAGASAPAAAGVDAQTARATAPAAVQPAATPAGAATIASIPAQTPVTTPTQHSDAAPATPGVGDQAATTDASVATAAAPATGAQAAKPAGVTFPVRPATTASTQAAPNAVGHASAADAGSIGGALFSLVLVVGLILGLAWLAKRMPGLQRGAGSAQLKVVASVALGPRDRAVVVDVGGTQLLLGVGQGGVRALHTLAAPLPVAEAAGAPTPFAQILAQHFGRKP